LYKASRSDSRVKYIDVDASVALLPDLRKNVPARLKYSGIEQW
jgi:hypothetical protein